jgi:hypothetical protein
MSVYNYYVILSEFYNITFTNHDGLGVATQGVHQELRQGGVSVRDSDFLALGVLSQSVDAVTQAGQGLVDGRTLFQSGSSSACTLNSFTV